MSPSSRTDSITVNYLDSADEIEETKRTKRFAKILTLSICYSANIGGTATLVGSPTNLLVAAVANQYVKARFIFIFDLYLLLNRPRSTNETQFITPDFLM